MQDGEFDQTREATATHGPWYAAVRLSGKLVRVYREPFDSQIKAFDAAESQIDEDGDEIGFALEESQLAIYGLVGPITEDLMLD